MLSRSFDPHTSFLHLKIVRVTIALLVILAFFFGVTIAIKSDLIFDLSYNGFNYFIEVFRFPLGILAMIIPIVALLAANHRSEQTKEQIKLTSTQNTFSNYYKHIEEFIKYNSSVNFGDVQGRYCHDVLFPNAKHGDYSLSIDVIEVIDVLIGIPELIFNNAPEDITDYMDDDFFLKYESIIRDALVLLSRDNISYCVSNDEKSKGFPRSSYLLRSKRLIIDTINTVTKLITVCEFSPEYIRPGKFKTVREISLDEVYVIIGDATLFQPNTARNVDDARYLYDKAKNIYLEKIAS